MRGGYPMEIMDRMRNLIIGLILLSSVVQAQFVISSRRVAEVSKAYEPVAGEPTQKCEISPIKPTLNYGFRYQAGYTMRTSMTDYVGKGHRLFLMTRITPEAGEQKPVYMGQAFRLGEIPNNKSDMEIGGGYILGPGRYQVAWMLIDDSNRVCRKKWSIQVPETAKVKLAIPPNTVTDMTLRGIPRLNREDEDTRKLRLTVLLHATPLSSRRQTLRSSDEVMLLSTLSSLLERIRSTSVKLVVFNLEKREQIYSKDSFRISDLEQVDDAINKIQLGMVDYKVLQEPKGHLDFLNDMLEGELKAEQPPDLVIFLGPPARTADKPALFELDKAAQLLPKLFYMRLEPFFYRPAMPGRPMAANRPPPPSMQMGGSNAGLPDSVSLAVKHLKGKTLTIRSPQDFAKAIEQVKAK